MYVKLETRRRIRGDRKSHSFRDNQRMRADQMQINSD